MARPTALAKPCPRGPVVTSIPEERQRWARESLHQRQVQVYNQTPVKHNRTIGDVNLGVTRGPRAELTELLEVLHREVVSGEVKHDVLKSAAVGV